MFGPAIMDNEYNAPVGKVFAKIVGCIAPKMETV